jgi:DNA-binding MarR family transcriptional regulator
MIEPIDLESRVGDGDHLSLRVWLRLLACTNLITGRARSKLRGAFDTTMPRFDLMAQLDRCPQGLKMNELSRRMMVTGGNVTRLVDQLSEEGLVARETAPQDRRVFTIRLTPAGRRAFAAMAQHHESWVVEMFGALSRKERLQLFALLAKLKAHVTELESGGQE